jgi:protein arginine kinase activator
MKKKCDKCDNPATIHLTEIVGGAKTEKHLCEDCAAADGITIKSNVPISQLLEDFVLQTGEQDEDRPEEKQCDVCGMGFREFRETGLLGCPNDYDAFADVLLPMLTRAQDTADHHVGKVPRNAGERQQRQNRILRLRADLKRAIHAEQYEQAASLRDQIKSLENV